MRNTYIQTTFLIAALTLGLLSCPYTPEPPDSDPDPDSDTGKSISLVPVAQGLTSPLYATTPPTDATRLFIVEQGGRIMLCKEGVLQETPFLDLSGLLGAIIGERGLLGLAFHPDYANNGVFFVNYTDTAGDTVIARYCRFADDLDRGDPESGEILLTFDQPFTNHNGGMLAFGPDGYLYIASGDGGSANDPQDNAQALDNLLGTVLRIDVDNGMPYAIPPDNPFVDDESARDEIWAYGLRNPWRFSFDRETGDLWIGDVGQNALEEINFQPAASLGGENYGWRNREGDMCRPTETECDLPGAVEPFHVYSNFGSQSVTGGYVYRGEELPERQGVYFFADYITSRVYALTQDGGGNVTVTDETDNVTSGGVSLSNIASFGEDANGELYLVDHGGGAVYKLVAS